MKNTIKRSFGPWIAIFIGSICGFAAAQANNATEAAEYHRQQARDRALREQIVPAPEVRLQAPPSTAGPQAFPAETPCFPISRVRIQGIPVDALDAWPWLTEKLPESGHWQAQSRCLGVQGIQRVIDSVQNSLIEHGYVTSRAMTAPQDLRSGELVLTLVPGRVRRIVLDDGGNHRATLRNALPVHEGALLNLRDIEQGLENFKRAPTADADIQIAPGDEPGQSDLLIRWRQGFPLRLLASIDDSGSKSTGKVQGSATLSCDNCLTLNDIAYVSVNHDLGGAGRGTRGASAYYAIPWGYQLLSLSASSNNYHQSVAGASQTYVYSGGGNQVEASLSRLVYRSAQHKLTLGVKAFRRHGDTAIDDTEVLVQRRTVGGWGAFANHRVIWGDATLEANLAHRRGTGALGAIPAPEEAFGEGTSRFGLITADLTGVMPLKLGEQGFVYTANWRWQGNRTSLTPQDRFAIGGRFTVRGFDGEQQLVAERGWLLRQELAWQVPNAFAPARVGLRQVYLALDHGQVGGPTAANLLGTSLTGAVLGLRFQQGGFAAEFFTGGPLARPQGFRAPRFVTGFNLSYSFN